MHGDAVRISTAWIKFSFVFTIKVKFFEKPNILYAGRVLETMLVFAESWFNAANCNPVRYLKCQQILLF